MSAESGMPTFREAQTGLWEQFDPTELASPQAWRADPEFVWAWYLWRHELARRALPNAGHLAIAEWESRAEVVVITQNVDDLHERAGSSDVVHVHGSLFAFRCADCASPYDGQVPSVERPVARAAPPRCPRCGSAVRPGVVWFGEALPEAPWERAVRAVGEAALLVVVGTSGVVYPAAGLPALAKASGARVVEVNPEPSALTGEVDEFVRAKAGAALPGLLDRLLP